MKADNTPITAGMLPYSSLDGTAAAKTVKYLPGPGDYSAPGTILTSFDFVVTDLSGKTSASARDNIYVTHVNHPPTATSQTIDVPEDGSVTISLAGADRDTGDAITFAMASISPNGGAFCAGASSSGCGSPLGGTSSIPNVGGFSAQVTYTPPRGMSGPAFASFTYKTTDNFASPLSSAAATVTINVLRANHPPTGASFTVNTPQDTPIAITFTSRMTDIDTPFVPAPGVYAAPMRAVIASLPSKGTIYKSAGGTTLGAALNVGDLVNTGSDTLVFVPATGEFSYRPPTAATYTTFDYTVQDAGSLMSLSSYTVTVQVSFVYKIPVVPTRIVHVPEDNAIAILLTATAPGTPTATFTFTITAITSPVGCLNNVDETKRCSFTTSTGAAITTFPTFTGPLALPDNNFNFLPGLDENGDNYATVTYIANDGTSDSLAGTLTIYVDAVNDPPIPNSRSLVSTNEDTPVTIDLTGTDVDGPPAIPEIVLLSAPPASVGRLYAYNAVNGPSFKGAPIEFNKTGSPLPDNGGQKMIAVVRNCNKFVFDPAPNWNGQLTIQYRAWDTLVFSIPSLTRLLTIKVIAVNDAPTLVFLNTQGTGPLAENKVSVAPGAQLLIKPAIGDVDADETPGGELKVTLTYSADASLELATSAARTTKAGTTKTVYGTLKQIQNALGTLNYKRDTAGTDTLTMVVNDQGNTGTGGPKSATATLTISVAVPAVVAPPAADNTGVVVGAAFAGVFGAVAAYAGWTKLHPKLFQQEADPFAGQAAGGENPLFEGQGFTSNALYESRM
jgi:hypothetical protein